MIKGHAKIVELLAPAADDANAPAPDGYTPTQLAARYGHVEVTKFFVSIVDNPNEPDFLGLSPVKSAINRGHWEVVKVNIYIFKLTFNIRCGNALCYDCDL